jgi:hypothetical protein
MKVLVLHDKKGKILSVTESPTAGPDQNSSRPIAMKGQAVTELDVPEEYSDLSIKGIHERLRVDVRARQPRFVAAKPAKLD